MADDRRQKADAPSHRVYRGDGRTKTKVAGATNDGDEEEGAAFEDLVLGFGGNSADSSGGTIIFTPLSD